MTNEKNNGNHSQENTELATFLGELNSIPWFQNVGKPVSVHNVKQVYSWADAWACLRDGKWTQASFHQHVNSQHPAWHEAYDLALHAISQSPYNHELEAGITAAD